MAKTEQAAYDLCIVGGGVNGCGIARDAAGRGLSVYLCEQGDLASATSSASSKLFHGGLRYLEEYELSLVRAALKERETLLAAMPHISWPLRFVLPHHRGLRPAWLLRLGLWIYDHLGGRRILPASRRVDLIDHPAGGPLHESLTTGFVYSDCWIDDARLVVLNARDAADRGAEIATRTRCTSAERAAGHWQVTVRARSAAQDQTIRARALINASGPWVDDVIENCLRLETPARIRLVRGSHIVVPRLFTHRFAYMFQQSDGRVVFAIPYEEDFTLIGTTDADHAGEPGEAACSADEAAYLCQAISGYFHRPVTPDQVVWSFSGVRPRHDDGSTSAAAATRDYVLAADEAGAAPLVHVFGGKITTYRRLAERTLEKLSPWFPEMQAPWTGRAAMPGGDFPVNQIESLIAVIGSRYPFLGARTARRLARAYGTRAPEVLGDAAYTDDLGADFGHGLSAREVGWLMENEWAETAEDVLWRRTKLGLRFSAEEAARLSAWMDDVRAAASAA